MRSWSALRTLDRVLQCYLSIDNIGRVKWQSFVSLPGQCDVFLLKWITNGNALLTCGTKVIQDKSNCITILSIKVPTQTGNILNFKPTTNLNSNLYNFIYFYILIIRIIYWPENLKD